jgi:hypothetical protein
VEQEIHHQYHHRKVMQVEIFHHLRLREQLAEVEQELLEEMVDQEVQKLEEQVLQIVFQVVQLLIQVVEVEQHHILLQERQEELEELEEVEQVLHMVILEVQVQLTLEVEVVVEQLLDQDQQEQVVPADRESLY